MVVGLFLLSCCSRNFLLSLSGYSVTQWRPFNGLSFHNIELKEFSPFRCLSVCFLDALLVESLLHRTFSSFGFPLCSLCTYSIPSWQSFSESSVILVFSELITEFFFHALLALVLNAHLAELYRIHS